MAFEIEYAADCYCRKCRKGFGSKAAYADHAKAKHPKPSRGEPIPEEYYSAADEEIDRIIGGHGKLFG